MVRRYYTFNTVQLHSKLPTCMANYRPRVHLGTARLQQSFRFRQHCSLPTFHYHLLSPTSAAFLYVNPTLLLCFEERPWHGWHALTQTITYTQEVGVAIASRM